MSTSGHSSPQSAVEAFVHGQIDLAALEEELEDCCANDEGAAWDALALLDQFHRRGRIADADFRVLMKRVNRHAQKPLGAASQRSRAERAKDARSTLTVPVGEDVPRKEVPLHTRPDDVLELDLDLNLDAGKSAKPASPVLTASRAAELDLELADLPAMHTRELPVPPPEPPVMEINEADIEQTMLITRAEPTVLLSRSPRNSLDNEVALGDFTPRDEVPAPKSGNDRVATRPIEPTMHTEQRVLRDRFELGPLLGRGGMASVFQARDRHREGASEREQWVAVKILNEGVIRADEGAKALQREFQHVQMLSHPAIVKVLDFDYDGATPFLVMELLEGESLESMLARGERFSRRVALALVHQLAVALGYAHSQDIVHADFKPGNVMVMPSGQVKILDLGVSWRWQREPRLASEDGRGSLLATPAYASQEVLNGGMPGVRDDIFSLGCLAYELLMGEHPFRRIPITKAHGQGLQPKRISWLTRPQWRTLASSLAWSRDARPASVQAFLDGLGLRGEPPVLPPPSKWSVAEASRAPTVVRVAIAAAACALVAVAVLPQWLNGTNEATDPLATAPPAVIPESVPPSMASPSPAAPPAAPRTLPRSERPAAAPSKTSLTSAAPAQPAPRVALTTAQLEGKPTVSAPPPTPKALPAPTPPAVRNESARDAAAGATAALARPGRIAFAGSTFNVNERESLARIELVRSRGSQGRVGVHWETEDVTALKDTDYADMGEQVAWFDNGQTRVTLLVPLVVGGEPKDLRAFRVRIKDPEGGAELAGDTEAMVVISGE